MNLNHECTNASQCLVYQSGVDRSCDICNSCRDGCPNEFAVHIQETGGRSRVLRFIDIAQVILDKTVERVSIYKLAEKPYYSTESISFIPESHETKQSLFAQVKAW